MKKVKRNGYANVCNRRVVVLFAFICVMFAALIFKIARIATSPIADIAAVQSTKKVLLGESRGYIYDRNRIPLVNTEKSNIGVVLCCDKTLDTVNGLLEPAKAFDCVKSGSLLTQVTEETLAESDCVKNFKSVKRLSDKSLCRHMLGYTDGTGNGVCGLEKAFNDVLREASGRAYAEITVDAAGNALAGDGVRIVAENYDSPAGLVLTLDSRIQEISEQALAESDITCGAVVVMDCNTGEILASASVPVYDPDDLAAYLEDEELPFLNRAVSAYPVGSVFKPFIAAAAMKSGISASDFFECTGQIFVGDQNYRCFNGTAHGNETLNEAIVNSCNSYFIKLGLQTGSENIISTCEQFGFGRCTELFPGDCSSGGYLPQVRDIQSGAQLANLCFGQGELLATPLQIAAAYSVIANGGIYNEPYMLKELVDNGGNVYGYFKPETEPYRVIDEDTCKYIGKCLNSNMKNGTGSAGRPANTTAAGKTATAQTGRYNGDGEEQLCTWFAGYFPYEKPQYTVVIFNEKGRSAAADCAPVFKNIAENIKRIK